MKTTSDDYLKSLWVAAVDDRYGVVSDEAARVRELIETSDKQERAAWSAITGEAAAYIEDAANCLRDPDAKRAAQGAAEFVRKRRREILAERSDKQEPTQLATQLPGYRAGFKQGYIEGHAEGVFDESERRADAEPVAQIVGDDKTRRLIWRCNAFDYDVGTELYALDKGASK
jgi:hypothetical protein